MLFLNRCSDYWEVIYIAFFYVIKHKVIAYISSCNYSLCEKLTVRWSNKRLKKNKNILIFGNEFMLGERSLS